MDVKDNMLLCMQQSNLLALLFVSLSGQIKEQKYGDVVQILSMELQSHPKVPPS